MGYHRVMDFQSTLFATGSAGELGFDGLERHELGAGAWVDVVPGWLVEPDDVFSTLVNDVPWRDSVAWHGDRIGRGNTHDTMVAIVSVGDPRRLAMRPRDRSDGSDSLSFEMGHGDLLVMGGSCQRTWEHAVPKVASAGTRISVQYRPLNVF